MSHILLEFARSYDFREPAPAPPGCLYDVLVGAWIVKESGILLVESTEGPRPPQSKKNDVETGEDQKGF